MSEEGPFVIFIRATTLPPAWLARRGRETLTVDTSLDQATRFKSREEAKHVMRGQSISHEILTLKQAKARDVAHKMRAGC